MSGTFPALDVHTSERHVRFVEQITGDDDVLTAFNDPAPCYAILVETSANAIRETAAGPHGDFLDDVLDVVLLPLSATSSGSANRSETTNDPNAPPPVFVKYRGVELMWRPGRATLQCDPEQAESLLLALVEFAHYESELRRIEDEIAGAWTELDQDKALAFEVTPTDLDRSEIVGARMDRVLRKRIRYARIEPHLYQPEARSSPAAQKLGEELRQKARIEARLETVDGQLEVFEHIYEMSSQRMGEYRSARQEHVLEWVIIILLGAEALLMLAQTVWKLRT